MNPSAASSPSCRNDLRPALALGRSGVRLALAGAALVFACGGAFAQTATVTRSGGIAGTVFGNAGALAGATTSTTVSSATPVTRARPATVVVGSGHIGAGTNGLGLGLGNAVGGIKDLAIGAGSGGLNDYSTRGAVTGGVTGSGLAFNAQWGGVKDTGGGVGTGGVVATAIGAGTGGLKDLDSLGASTGGAKEGANAPRYRVIQ